MDANGNGKYQQLARDDTNEGALIQTARSCPNVGGLDIQTKNASLVVPKAEDGDAFRLAALQAKVVSTCSGCAPLRSCFT